MKYTLSEKALEYAHAKEKPKDYEAAIRGYIQGYNQAQSENPFRWRDPRKEKPECCPVGDFTFVIASINSNGLRHSDVVQYIKNGKYDKWRRFKGEEIEDLSTDSIQAWMPLPHYRPDMDKIR